MPSLSYSIIDAFTSTPFAGNPASVILFPADFDASKATDDFHLKIAREFNLSETAFLTKKEGGSETEGKYGLKWFTPVMQINLCGHATLASSYLLFSQNPSLTKLSFATLSGELTALKLPSGQIELNFPADEAVLEPISKEDDERIRKGTEIATNGVVNAKDGIKQIVKASSLGFQVEIDSSIDLANLKVDGDAVIKHTEGVLTLTQASTDATADVKSRVFGPRYGIPEDPVTGSTHCCLAPYWLGNASARSRLPSSFQGDGSKMELNAHQVSPRGGILGCVWDKAEKRVRLRGNAVEVMRGELLNI